MAEKGEKTSLARGKPTGSQIYEPRIKIIGIGGGGSSIVSEIASQIKRASFIVVDADQRVLKELPSKIKHFQFDQKLIHALKAKKELEEQEQTPQDEREKIKGLLRGVDFCILVSCLGGEAGSGISPVFAEISRELRNITLGIFILPFEFEEERKMEIAKFSLEKIRKDINASVIISNQKLLQAVKEDTPLKEALSIVNKQLGESLRGLIEMFYASGLFCIDFTDLKTILAGRGKFAFLNTIETKFQGSVQIIARKVLHNRLSPYLVFKAKRILFNIMGAENLSLNEVNQIGSIITKLVNPRAKIVFGITQNKKYEDEDKIKIVLLATDCQWQEWEKKKPKKKPTEKKLKPRKLPKEFKRKISKLKEGRFKESETIKEEKEEKEKEKMPDAKQIPQLTQEKKASSKEKWNISAFLRRKLSQIEKDPGK